MGYNRLWGVFIIALLYFVPSSIAFEKENPISCETCVVVFDLLDFLLDSNATLDDVTTELGKICTALKISKIDANVCNGAINSFAPEVWPILLSIGINAKDLCRKLGYCSNSKFTVLNGPLDQQNIKESNIPNDSSKFYVVQISDIHFDEFYTPGATADCNEPLCCRPWNAKGNRKAAKWGDYNCDLTLPMFESLLQYLTNINPQPNIIVWTGDNTAHDIWNETKIEQMNRIKYVSHIVAQYFPDTPVFPVIGNHDTFPVDQFNRKPIDFSHYDDFDWLLSGLAEAWSTWLPADALETLRTGGYYSTLAAPGLRVIGLNTQWGDSMNFYLLLEENQQQTQFSWLKQTLQSARSKGEKVILLGHIPSGFSIPYNFTTYADEYVNIANMFGDIIVGQFFGHTHNDEFQIVIDDNNPTGVIYIAPSVTTFTNHNPSFRIYEYNGQFELLDYHQFVANLSLANEIDKPTWFLEYSAMSEYNLKDLSAPSWLDLVQRFKADDQLFQRWFINYRTGATGTCDADCKKAHVCDMLSATPDLNTACLANQ